MSRHTHTYIYTYYTQYVVSCEAGTCFSALQRKLHQVGPGPVLKTLEHNG